MSNGQKFIATLLANGFKKVPWNKCPQGFEKANYPCYSNEEKNIWAEVYLDEKWQYMFIEGDNIKPTGTLQLGTMIDEPKDLKTLLKTLKL